ncbi:MAG: fasciclin [Flavobacteriales bacterium]|nr:fasciclin [Flavobacteriales bacterium]
MVSNSADHTTLLAAVDACSLDATLSGPGPFTLFAPTDAAFNLLPAGTVAALLNDIPQLTDILLHHVVGDSVMSGMLSNNQTVTTLLGTDVTVTINSSGVYIDNAFVSVADYVADNGVVHVIDAVLLPNQTSIEEETSNGYSDYMYSLNILGEKVNRIQKNQIVFDIYSDGTIIKRYVK